MKGALEFMKIRTKFMSWICVILLLGGAWIGYSSYDSAVRQSTSDAAILADTIREAVYSFMLVGQQSILDAYLVKARKVASVGDVRVARSEALDREIGPKTNAPMKDELELQVLSTGQQVTREVVLGKAHAIRCVTPIVATHACIACHTGSKDGDVIAVLNTTVLYQMKLDAMKSNLLSLAAFQGIFILCVLGAIFIIFHNFIMRPINRLGGFINKLTQGDFTSRIVMRSKGAPEASGAPVDAGIDPSDEIGELAAMFNKLAVNLQGLITQIRDAGLEINASGSQINSFTNEQSVGAIEQASAVNQASITVKELAATASQIAQNAENVAKLAERSMAGMMEINAKVDGSANMIMALGQKSQAIGNIAKLIDDIAEQTNLLALNAAIEAARAGDAGMGFAVVADEVRKLAERSSKSTEEIRQLITQIQTETSATILGIEDSVKWVGKGVEMIRETAGTAKEISIATQQQRTASDQMVQAMQNINVVTKQFAASSKQAAIATNTLSALARKLKTSIEGLKLG